MSSFRWFSYFKDTTKATILWILWICSFKIYGIKNPTISISSFHFFFIRHPALLEPKEFNSACPSLFVRPSFCNTVFSRLDLNLFDFLAYELRVQWTHKSDGALSLSKIFIMPNLYKLGIFGFKFNIFERFSKSMH